MSANISRDYEQNRLSYLAAQETMENLEGELSKIEGQMIDSFINDARVFASTLTTWELVVKNRNLNFVSKRD
jgi:hypothetical protein